MFHVQFTNMLAFLGNTGSGSRSKRSLFMATPPSKAKTTIFCMDFVEGGGQS